MKNDKLILGLDIGGTNFRLGLVDYNLSVFNLEVFPSSGFSKGNVLDNIFQCIDDYMLRNDRKKQIIMIAAGWPSLVDKSRRILNSSTNFPGIDGIDIVSYFEKKLGLPIIIEHDAYYLLAFDIYKNNVSTDGAVLGFYFGTGMGNAIFIDGKPFIGNSGAASEIGHMPMGLGDRICSCGNNGCVEMYCCGKAFEKLVSVEFPNCPIDEVFKRNKENRRLDDFVKYMAIPISTEINILDPKHVFIGGGLVAMKDFPRQKLKSYVLEKVRKPYPFNSVNISFSENSPQNGIIGSAIMAHRKIAQFSTEHMID